jgi:hypothetical protein
MWTALRAEVFQVKRASPRLFEIVSPRPHLSKVGPVFFCKKGQKNLPVPRQEARFDSLRGAAIFRICRDGTRNGLVRSEQGTAQGRESEARSQHNRLVLHERRGRKERGLARGASGLISRQTTTIEPVFALLQAPVRRSCDVLDTLPLGEVKRVFPMEKVG